MAPDPTFDLLLADGAPPPAAERLAPDPDERRLGQLLAHPAPAAPRAAWVRANMVATLDGGAWGDDERSGSINDAADHRVFEVLRALADVVLVGAGTVRAEGYGPVTRPARLAGLTRTAGRDPQIVTAVVSRSGVLPAALLEAGAPTLLLTTAAGAAPHARTPIEAEGRLVVADDGHGGVDLAIAVGALAARGLVRVLTEGGPHLLGSLLDAGLVDELMVTTSPLLVGPEPGRIVAGRGMLDATARPQVLLHADGTLVTRWVLRRPTPRAIVEGMTDTTVILAEDALTSFDVAHILEVGSSPDVRYRLIVPADTERNMLVGLLNDIYTEGFRGAFAEARRGMPDTRTATVTAQQSIDRTVAQFAAAGATITGEVTQDDPLPALRAAVAADPTVTAVVVVTDPHPVEDTFRQDWASRAREALDLPVLHLYRGTSMLG